MLILSTKLKNRFSPAHIVALKNIRVNADARGCSGFIALNGAIIYVNTERCGSLGYMYRTAAHMKDYTGGVSSPLSTGHIPKRELANLMHAFISGLNEVKA